MHRVPYPRSLRKMPRPKPHKLVPVLRSIRESYECSEYCSECMAEFEAQAERERPGHVWAVDKGKVIFLEDVVVEHRLGRKLMENEAVVHRNSNVLDNRDDNLEVVRIPNL